MTFIFFFLAFAFTFKLFNLQNYIKATRMPGYKRTQYTEKSSSPCYHSYSRLRNREQKPFELDSASYILFNRAGTSKLDSFTQNVSWVSFFFKRNVNNMGGLTCFLIAQCIF